MNQNRRKQDFSPKVYVKTKLKVDDEVIVISGKAAGKRGKIMSLDRRKNRAVVQGVNLVKRFQRPTQENPHGGVLEVEFPLPLPKLMYYDSKTKRGRRIHWEEKNGSKVRVIFDKQKKEKREIKEKEKEK